MIQILVLYYSRSGHVKTMAEQVARGIESVAGCQSMIRTVPAISTVCEATENNIPEQGHLYITADELRQCDGLILGSPTRFGNMAAPLKHFLDSCGDIWLSGDLIGKPAAVFTATGSLHGGQESTLLSMMLPLFHQGMILLGLPYDSDALMTSHDGGTPYGASHLSGQRNERQLSDNEAAFCRQLGKRTAITAQRLQ